MSRQRKTLETLEVGIAAAAEGESCANCKYFLQIDNKTVKGICRYGPPQASDDRNATPIPNDSDGRRWPLCWGNEWCGKWSKVLPEPEKA